MNKGQSAVLDALILITICASASGLLLYVAQVYGSTSNKQMIAVYNFEYANTALLSLRFVTDDTDTSFWEKLREILKNDVTGQKVQDYLRGDANSIFMNLTESSPGELLFKFDGPGAVFFCHQFENQPIFCGAEPNDFCDGETKPLSECRFTTYAVSTGIKDLDENIWTITLEIYF